MISKTKKAFTLVELIIVLAILGILASIAIPKFGNMSGKAKKAAVEALAGAVSSAATISHGKWLISPASTITIEGKTIKIYNGTNSPGYPSETSGGINNAVNYNPDKFTFSAGTDNNDSSNARFTMQTNCYVEYSVNSTTYNVSTVVSGCK
jgi:MSHA pilin protein MshA